MRYYGETFGIGPWEVYTFGPKTVRDSMVRRKSSSREYLLALTWRGSLQLELMQPVSGRSIYDEMLERTALPGLTALPPCRVPQWGG